MLNRVIPTAARGATAFGVALFLVAAPSPLRAEPQGPAARVAEGQPARAKQTTLGLYVTAAQAYEMWKAAPDKIKIIDVRTPEEFAAGHIPGAINIPVGEIGARLAELEASRDKTIVAYCRSGRRAGVALKALHEAGFTKLSHLAGDMPGWEESAK